MLKATSCPPPAGKVAGFEYLVPKPEPDHGYAVTYGDVLWATAMAVPSPLKATPFPVPAGKVAGFEYLVPKPEEDHGYAVTYGDVA